MSVQRKPAPARVAVMPKHTHYVSMMNDGIYQALSSPSGYEDEHPDEFRPATPDEIAKYKAGAESVKIEHIDLSESEVVEQERASPMSLKLADEDPEVPPAPAAVPPGPAPVMVRSV